MLFKSSNRDYNQNVQLRISYLQFFVQINNNKNIFLSQGFVSGGPGNMWEKKKKIYQCYKKVDMYRTITVTTVW